MSVVRDGETRRWPLEISQDWSLASVASLHWHASHEHGEPAASFEAFSVESSVRRLLGGSNLEKLYGARTHLRGAHSVEEIRKAWDAISPLVASARPARLARLDSKQIDQLVRILKSDDLIVPAEPHERWFTSVTAAASFLRSIGLPAFVELLTMETSSIPTMSPIPCLNMRFKFATLRPLEELRHIIDPQNWDDCSPLFLETHALANPKPPSGSSWNYDFYEEVGFAMPGPGSVPFTCTFSNLLDCDFQCDGTKARADYGLIQSYEDVVDVDQGFFEARDGRFVRCIGGSKCLHFTCAPLNRFAALYLAPLLTLTAMEGVTCC